ncbi:hypothetical protein [Azospirillum sp. B4]|uniref:hypothetical protein n=1 Tax=Azospirillum sp. B4 TaxID=95605 RepID=UPI0005CB71FC|nr:hypothetical protein [Azospirillum sp. B4]
MNDADFESDNMSGEKSFVRRACSFVNQENVLNGAQACYGQRLDYASYCWEYDVENAPVHTGSRRRQYETDLLIYDEKPNQSWTPLVIVEFKYRSVTTHDLLAYGAKAEAHRSRHPYIRYGLTVGGWDKPFQGRMFAHGAPFDFMAIMPTADETDGFRRLTDVLRSEITAARRLKEAHMTGAFPPGTWLMHRPLVLG